MAKGQSGKDAYHRDQDFVWISSREINGDVGIINNLRPGRKTLRQNEDQDKKAFHKIPSGDSNQVKHQWWIPEPNRTDCLVHFVKECLANNSDPLEVMHCSSKGSDNSSPEERKAVWRNYVTMASNKINIESLPLEVHHIHNVPLSLELKIRERGKEKHSKHNTGRKRKAVIMIEKTTAMCGKHGKVPRTSKEAGMKVAQSGATVRKPPPKSKTLKSASSPNVAQSGATLFETET